MAYLVTTAECEGDEVCVDICPDGCITMEDGKAVIDAAACTDCGACEAECPYGAIVAA